MWLNFRLRLTISKQVASVMQTSTYGVLLNHHHATLPAAATNHIVNRCPLTKSEGDLPLLCKAEDDAVKWPASTVTIVIAK